MKKSWKTTAGGIALAIGQALISGAEQIGPWAVTAGQILSIVGAALLGISARDNKVTSEAAGAVRTFPESMP